MSHKLTTMMIIAVFCIVCTVPLASEESDGSTNIRVSEYYLVCASFTVEPDSGFGFSDNYFIMRDGSSNDQLMDRYLANPKDMSIKITSDDRDDLYTLTAPTKFNVYMVNSNNVYNDIWFNGYQAEGTVVLEPYNTEQLKFFVKAGDTFDIDMVSTNNYGDATSPRVIVTSTMEEYSVDKMPMTMAASTTVYVDPSPSYNLYCDVTYTASGYSAPNGSPALYVAVCAIITVAVLALLVLASIKPKWSK